MAVQLKGTVTDDVLDGRNERTDPLRCQQTARILEHDGIDVGLVDEFPCFGDI